MFVFAGQSDQQAAWRRFQNAAASAAAICYGPPTFSSQFWPADITDADLLEEARSLLLDAQPASRSPDADWNQAVLHASSLILMPELNEAYDYFLVPFQGDTYILTPAQWDAEAYTPVAVLEDQNVISALEDLTRTQYERNQEQTESESGFSPEGLTFSSSGGSFDQVAQDFGAALAQAYLDLSTDDPKAVVFAQTGSWEITQTLPEDGDRFCVRLSLVVQPLAPNTVYWMAGAGLDLTEDGRWLDTHEYRLERVEGDTWICAEYGGSINLPGEDTTVQNAGAQTSDSETWTDGLSFSGLAPGGEAVRSEAVQIPEGGADFIYTITYARPSLTLEAGLRGIDGTEYHQRVEDGDAHGTPEDIPAGIYTLFVRNVGDYTHFPSYQDGSGDYAATGAINFYFGTDTNSSAE